MLDSTNAEVAWNQNSPTQPGAGGGAPSEVFVKPAYQMGVTPDDGARDLPDVAAIAGTPDVNVYLLRTNLPVGGTSVASPLWAGIWSLVDQAHGGTGLTDGLTRIYAAGKSTGFNDVTKGDNGGPNDTGVGYSAGVGYDLATGWGTPGGINLVTALATPDDLGIFPGTGFNALGPVGGPGEVRIAGRLGGQPRRTHLRQELVWPAAGPVPLGARLERCHDRTVSQVFHAG